ncbi:hypothetical protein CesoFtcFv8_018595 [Champsocephalus esox]|uniref:Intercellular adhesion molecule N-terminal domain-containing protein n=1 Tax=Champsocephalus esox TaxID=159716 RepID=A0AAN8GP86_9TELE|nr:hypothetical protein CesoFtcFv8_018595 [Champsocephalus esox]
MKLFLVLSVFIVFTGNPVSSSCEIEFSPPKVVVRFGDPFSLNCSSTSNQIDSMGWEAIYGTGIGLQDGVSSVALKIDSVKDWKMEPQCFVNLENGVQCSETLNFIVYKMPDFISQPSQMDHMVEGESLPKIQSKPQKLIVLYSPTFTKPENETFELSARNKIMLNCTATGNPMPGPTTAQRLIPRAPAPSISQSSKLQGTALPLQPWLEDLCSWEPCSSLAVFFL